MREHRHIRYDETFLMATLPSTPRETALVHPSRGITVHYLSYWNEIFRRPDVARTKVPVRYDPFDIGVIYAYVHQHWVECISNYYGQFRGHSEKELVLATAEIHEQNRRSHVPDPITAKRLAAFLEGELFDRTDYYHTTFKKLGIHTQSASEKRERGNRSPRYHEDPALRNALEETLKRQQIRAVFLDEAQHLMKASNGAKPRDQLDWIKSMTNLSGVLHVLLGTYDLLHFCNLDGQSARRGLEIHFPRYNFQDKDEREAFQAALLSLLRQVPLPIDEQALMNGWWEFYKRSIGCIGVLKQWLVRATALALREESKGSS